MNLYAEYIKERENKDLIEKDYGFCTYEILGQYVYLADVYVSKDERQKGLCKDLVEEVVRIGKENGCKHILTSFCLKATNWEISKKVIKQCGFKFHRKDKVNKIIYTIMEIN